MEKLTKTEIIAQYHHLWYNSDTTWKTSRWMGIPTEQNPNDIWVTQEILFETKPGYVIECGSKYGGSAALWAMLLREINPYGRVISIDLEDKRGEARKLRVVQERVEFLTGNSVSPEIIEEVKMRVQGKSALVILDSDHSKAHVLAELKSYGPFVKRGGYLIVQDTNINGHPILSTYGPGPMEAVQEFLAGTNEFVADRSRERLLMTLCPCGYLRRVNYINME